MEERKERATLEGATRSMHIQEMHGHIIPRPGEKPTWWQYVLVFGICALCILVIGLVEGAGF